MLRLVTVTKLICSRRIVFVIVVYFEANMINLGEIFPNFAADTTIGKIQFHEWLDDA